ncbi:permease-like cell division protein FtsX [Coralloluteibacterium stylophorae]|uniref:Cell division protein FtsX n=1 Tax=Coralloluteibacterium stylophorae TaxID=1776034 RepID=A0AAP2CBQ6_9GAMM|nr:permease-like cell division protein FtsX [Coralloluteibacterium stylophorae]
MPEPRKKPGGARQKDPRANAGERLRAWREQHVFGLVSSLGRIAQRPWATLLTVGVMAVALALPLGLWLSLKNVERFSGHLRDAREIGVFLHPEVPLDRARALAGEIAQRADVDEVLVTTPEDGLAQFRQMDELATALDALDGNPLPAVLTVVPVADATDGGAAVAAAMQVLPEAEIVQHDAVWRERLDRWLAFGERVVIVVGLLLGLGTLLVVGNTVRLDIAARAEEIGVLQLLGATDRFVRRPFLYLGAWYGLGAGLLTLAILAGAGLALRPTLAALATSYGSAFALEGPGAAGAATVLVVAVALGWVGARLASGHHLRLHRPVEL